MPITPTESERPWTAASDPRRGHPRVRRLPTALGGDLRGGLATFLGSVYIVALIPMILRTDAAGAAVTSVAATALACAAGTALFALGTRLPLAVGPGIVPASVVASFLAGGMPFDVALGIEVLAGLAFLLLAATGLVRAWVRRAPPVLKGAGQVAIGLYLLLAALRAGGVLHDGGSTAWPGAAGLWFLAGLAVVLLLHRHPRLGSHALLIGIGLATAGAASSGLLDWPRQSFELPALVLPRPDLSAALDLRYLDELLVLLYVVVVDVVATLEAIASCSPDLRGEDGCLLRFDRGLLTSALVFLLSPFLGTAPMLVLFESLGGVLSGARTAVAALVCVLGFGLVLFVAPLAHAVPACACAVALAYVGLMIARHALASLPAAAGGTAAALAGPLAGLAVIVMIVTHSVALTLFALFALYPLLAWKAGQRPRRSDMVAALAGLLLMAMVLR